MVFFLLAAALRLHIPADHRFVGGQLEGVTLHDLRDISIHQLFSDEWILTIRVRF